MIFLNEYKKFIDNFIQRCLRCQTFLPFALELIKKDIIFSENIPFDSPAATDQKRIFINPNHKFFSDNILGQYKLSFSLLHEACHILFMHDKRRGNKNFEIWWYACDFMINLFLDNLENENKEWEDQQNLIVLKIKDYSSNICYNKKFDGMIEEEIYHYLESNGNFSKEESVISYKKFLDDVGIPSDDVSNDSQVKITKSKLQLDDQKIEHVFIDFPKTESAEEQDQSSEGTILSKTLLDNTIISKGFQNSSFERFIKKLLNVKISWTDILRDSILTNMQKSSETSWSSPRICWLANPLLPYLPNVTEEERYGTLAFLIDESGSVYDEDIAKSVDVIKQAKEYYKNILVIKHDTNVVWSEIYDDITEKNIEELLTRKACGGTSHASSFQKVLDYSKQEGEFISMILSVTDMWSDIETSQNILPNSIPRIYLTRCTDRDNSKVIGKIITI